MVEIDKVIRMFKENNLINVRIFLKRYGIFIPSAIQFAYIIEEKGNYMFVHLYPQAIPLKILVTLDKEKGEITVDWVEVETK